MSHDKVASVIVVASSLGRGSDIVDVYQDGDVVHFPCPRERIGGVYLKKIRKRKGTKKEVESLVCFDEFLKKFKEMGCKEIEFSDGLILEVE